MPMVVRHPRIDRRTGEVNSEKIDEELVMKPYGQVTLKLEFKKIKEGRNFEC